MDPRIPMPRRESRSRPLHTGRARFVPTAAWLVAIALGGICVSHAAASPNVAPAPAVSVPKAELPAIKAPALRVVVTIAPLKSFVEPLLPEGSQLRVLMQPGKSEHGYEFTPSDLRALAQADIVVLVGVNLEPAVERALASRPDASRRVVRFADVAGIKLTNDAADDDDDHEDHDHADHDHAEHEDHDHDGHHHGPIDPHLWLDPALCTKLVGAVRASVDAELTERNALSDEAKAALTAREAELRARIDRVDKAWRDAAPALAASPIVTHHNAFQRLADRYGLHVAAVIRDVASSDPSPAQVARVARVVREQHVRAIFVEPQFDRRLADRIAQSANVKVATLDPLGTGDWFALMDANLASLRANLEPAATVPGPTAPLQPAPNQPAPNQPASASTP